MKSAVDMEEMKTDPRFAHISSDPRFRPMPKSKRKVRVDPRFQAVFSDRRFSHKTDVDKRGRPVLAASSQHVMRRFYELSDSDQEIDLLEGKQKVDKLKKGGPPDVSSSSKRDRKTTLTNIVREKKNKTIHSTNTQEKDIFDGNLAQEDAASSTSSSDDDDESDDDELAEFTQEHVLEETEVDHRWNELQEDAPAGVESTRRLAVCNMDWDFVKAKDLFILFKSFIPEGGSIKSVTIYPSEFGKERMAEEARLGPKEMRQQSHSSQAVSPAAEKGRKKKQVTVDQQQVKRSTKELEATNTEKLREYQLNRLRYYFAVVMCDSVRTADTVYSECDGREYLLSSVRLDLRFIPDGMSFDDQPKDVFSDENSILEYEPHRFSSTALCQAKVDVTWDETDLDRLSRRLAGLQQKELESIVEENKYADIIAPPESDSEEDVLDQPDWLKQATLRGTLVSEEEKIDLYRRLLVDKPTDEGEEEGGDNDDEKEYVWQPGLKSAMVKEMQKKDRKKADSGVVTEYLEKKREKKRKKKDGKLKKTGDGHKDELGPDFVGGLQVTSMGQRNQPETNSLKRKKKRSISGNREKEAGGSDTAGLELLVMDGGDNVKAENRDAVGRSKRRKKSKKKRLSEDKDDVLLDVNDTRFGALYTSHHFHIDPTAAQFKKTKSMGALVDEQIRRRARYARPQSTNS